LVSAFDLEETFLDFYLPFDPKVTFLESSLRSLCFIPLADAYASENHLYTPVLVTAVVRSCTLYPASTHQISTDHWRRLKQEMKR